MKRFVLLAVGLALVAAACAQARGTGADSGASSAQSPDGDWILASGVPIAEGGPITLSVEGEEIGGRAACNTYGGTAAISGATFEMVQGSFFMTEMGCLPEIQASEGEFVSALFGVTRWAVIRDHLQLTGQDVNLVFEPVANIPTAAIVGTDWVLESLISGDSVSSVSGDPTLFLGEDGTVAGSTGCRELSGTWVVGGGELFFPSLSANGDCGPELAAQDGSIIAILEGGFTAQVTGDRLEVTDASGQGLVYRSR